MKTTVCPHRPPCPGCPSWNQTQEDPEKLLRLQALTASHGGQLLETLQGNSFGFRNRARLAIRGRVGNPKIGIFQAASHRIADIPSCPVHHPAINTSVAHIKDAMRTHRIAPYVEGPRLGLLRYVQLVVSLRTGQVQLTLVVTNKKDKELPRFMSTLTESMGPLLHSAWINENKGVGNAILGPDFDLVFGREFLEDNFAGRQLYFHPGAFGQSNMALAAEMVKWIDEEIPKQKSILEYHAGVGAIGLGLIENSMSYHANEISPWGLMGLQKSLDQNPSWSSKSKIHVGMDHDFGSLTAHADVIICDPPRKGMLASLARTIAEAKAEKIILIYCGFESFLRDVEIILSQGVFQLSKIRPVALFPHTDHMEVVAVLERK